ncbi:MAG: clan AA aspartic protease [Salinibacter sp.]
MTTGFFTAEREAALSLEAIGPDGGRSFDAIIDTGFTGELPLPSDWIEDLGLPYAGVEEMMLADGRFRETAMYDGYVIIDDEAYEVVIAEAPTIPLVETNLLWGFSIFIEFQSGGAIEVESLPHSAS